MPVLRRAGRPAQGLGPGTANAVGQPAQGYRRQRAQRVPQQLQPAGCLRLCWYSPTVCGAWALRSLPAIVLRWLADINPNANGPTKFLDGSIDLPIAPDL